MPVNHATLLNALPLFLTLEDPFFDQHFFFRPLLQCLVQLVRLHVLLQLLSLTDNTGCDTGVWQDIALDKLATLWSLGQSLRSCRQNVLSLQIH